MLASTENTVYNGDMTPALFRRFLLIGPQGAVAEIRGL